MSGDYTVTVQRDVSGEAFTWHGWADNPSDALSQALNAREAEQQTKPWHDRPYDPGRDWA